MIGFGIECIGVCQTVRLAFPLNAFNADDGNRHFVVFGIYLVIGEFQHRALGTAMGRDPFHPAGSLPTVGRFCEASRDGYVGT